MTKAATAPSSKPFGRFLKFWRQVHKISQEQLADKLGSSPRHISRLENGASQPSETITEEIARVFNLGERDRNHLRIAAGFSVQEAPIDFNAPDMRWLRKAMAMTLNAMNPFPTTLSDSSGKLLMVNKGWVNFYRQQIDQKKLDAVTNSYDFLFSHVGAGALLTGWEDTLALVLMALKQNALLSNEPRALAAIDHYLTYPSVPKDWQQRAAKLEPMASFRIQVNYNGKLERFYSVSQTVGALGPAAYLAEPRLTISSIYPESDDIDLALLFEPNCDHPLLC